MTRSACGKAVTMLALLAVAGCAPTEDSVSETAATETAARRRELPMPLVHHVGLNVVAPGVSMEWYQVVWPEGEASTLDGKPAMKSTVRGTDPPQDFYHVFNQVDHSAPGGWDNDQHRTIPQSPFWHIGTYEDTSTLKSRFDELGVTTLPMWTALDGDTVWNSGESPYRGMQTMDRIAQMETEEPRAGGFGYIVGPDGELVETSGTPQSRRGVDHIHLFHEQPWCAANWYIEHLGMRPVTIRNPGTGEQVEIEIPDPCDVELGAATFPSLEPSGTLRNPRATVRYGYGTMSAYTRQCRFLRCGEDQELVSSEGQVLDHVGFLIPDLELHLDRLRSEGVRIVQEIHPFDDTRAAMIADPDGLLLHLVERP